MQLKVSFLVCIFLKRKKKQQKIESTECHTKERMSVTESKQQPQKDKKIFEANCVKISEMKRLQQEE